MSGGRVVVIGAGVNGLVAATLLAKRGYEVRVLERRDVPGGMAAAEEFHPGYRTAGLLHDVSGVRPGIVADLALEEHGLELAPGPPDVLAAAGQGPGLLVAHDAERAHREIAAVSPDDADAYAQYRAFLGRVGPVVARRLDAPPPNPGASGWELAREAWELRGLGRADALELARVAPMCVADWMAEWFTTDALGAVLAMPALVGGRHGPWAPATAALSLRREVMAGRTAVRGPSAVVDALVRAAAAHGVKLHLSTEVAAIRLEQGRVRGVTTVADDDVPADAVVATCDPKTTILRLVPRDACPPRLAEAMRTYRSAGTTAKVHLALDRPLRFTGREDTAVAHACTGTDFDAMERAFDPPKYGRDADEPLLDIHVPSVSDPSCAPDGHAVVSILAHTVAPHLDGACNVGHDNGASEGQANEARARVGDAVVRTLARVAPGVEESIVAREVLLPADLERRFGVTGGDVHHGEHGLDQLLVRPCRDCARHRTPWRGLFLGGAGSWPGGGVHGGGGALAVRAVSASLS